MHAISQTKANKSMNVSLPCYCNALRQASRVITTFYDDQLRPLGLRVSQYSMLQTIRNTPGIATGSIARALDMDQTTASRAIAALTREGWVLAKDGDDRREKHWTLTSKGSALLKRAEAAWRASQREIESKLGRERATNLRAVAEEVVSAIARP
jgi:DNA-binding MarR family transcriptional regulator